MQVKLAYVEQGNPSGIPVIMLHGWTDSWRSFERVLPNLPESLHVFALSMRGHGDSGRPLRGYTPGDFSRDVAEFMDALRLPRGVIVGHCMGGMIAQRFAAERGWDPRRLEKRAYLLRLHLAARHEHGAPLTVHGLPPREPRNSALDGSRHSKLAASFVSPLPR